MDKEREQAIQDLRSRADEIARTVTAMHPVTSKLGDAAVQSEVMRALFELTKQVEVVKKQVLRLQKRDDSTVL